MPKMHGRLVVEEQYPLTDVVVLPCLYGMGMREVPVVDVQIKAIGMLQKRPMRYGELEAALMADFTLTSEESVNSWRRLTGRQLSELIYKGVLAVGVSTDKDIINK